MILTLIGNICLNCAFILYLFVYLPQIIHNRDTNHIANLSLKMHFTFYIAYILDLFYGFSSLLPWQYRMVSIIGVGLLTVQHIQLTRFFWSKDKQTGFNILFLLSMIASIIYFFIVQQAVYSEHTTLVIGYVSRVGFLFYTVPQILKNKRLQSTSAISTSFVYINLTLAILDLIAAWCLDWGWPNKLGAPITVCLMFTMLLQTKQYHPANSNTLSTQRTL